MSKLRTDICHKWAHGQLSNKQYARESVYAEGETLFSYGRHFPLGVRCGTVDGKPAFLLNSRSYSVTTSKHQRETAYATNHGARLYVPMFNAPWSTRFVTEMVEQMQRDQQTAEADTASRGSVKRNNGLMVAQGIAETAKALPVFLKGAGVKLERSQAAALRKLATWQPADREQVAERIKAAKEAAERKVKREQARRKREQAKALEQWKRGERDGIFEEMALRLSGENVETSRGANVPAESARLLWKAWEAGAQMIGRHVGPYIVNEQTADHVRIGCHVIGRATAQAFALQMGW